jgi:hypothetical protein
VSRVGRHQLRRRTAPRPPRRENRLQPSGGRKKYARGGRRRELKVFVQGYRDFAAYIAALRSGQVSRGDNAKLWDLLKANWECLGTADLINHNLDVDTLHFKYDRR